ncbi:MAG: sporulation membrane protein YtaF [Desulfotomaculaceae bacterium]|nr:sporulation membrane protein YtaF [Desulfotomaculaceae bacterium]
MEILSYILFALALNVDSFCTGLTYGAKSIKVPPLSLLIISLVSMLSIAISMAAGRLLAANIPAPLVYRLGSGLLLLLGFWVLFQTLRKQAKSYRPSKNSVDKTVEIRLRPFGLIIQLLKEPARADVDSSGVISAHEALVLGAALAVDAFVAGCAVSLLGFSILVTAPAVGVGYFLLACLGIATGRSVSAGRVGRQLTALPGCILILLGLLKIC